MNNKVKATKVIKYLMEDSEVGYKELAKKFKAIGKKEDNVNLSNKINRGTFSAEFLFDVVDVLGYEFNVKEKENKQEKHPISKEEFADKYLQIHEIWKSSNSEVVYNRVEMAKRKLYASIGLSFSIIKDAIENYNDDVLALELKKERVLKYYDELMAEQKLLNSVDDILKEL